MQTSRIRLEGVVVSSLTDLFSGNLCQKGLHILYATYTDIPSDGGAVIIIEQVQLKKKKKKKKTKKYISTYILSNKKKKKKKNYLIIN